MQRPVLRWPGEGSASAEHPHRPEPGGEIPRERRTGGDGDKAFSLLAIDFQGIYQVHVATAAERITMLRFALSLLAAPFAATVALVSADVVSPQVLTEWPQVPSYLFGLLTTFGVLAALPLMRMIEASISHARTARALNNFRLLYTLELQERFAAAGWSPNLPVDPVFPDLFTPMTWAGVSAIVLAVLDAASIVVGLVGLGRLGPQLVIVSVGGVAVIVALFTMYFLRVTVSRGRRRPANPFEFPSVET